MIPLGYVPYVGNGLSVLSYAYDVYDGFGNKNYFYTREATILDNEANIYTYETNNTDQINARGNLIKSQAVSLKSDDAAPRLIHVDGGYAEAKYVIARKSGSENNKMRVTTSISIDVVADNTSKVLWIEKGEITDYGRATGTYETGAYKRLSNYSVNGTASCKIEAGSQKKIIRIIPRVSGSYKIWTLSSYGDPNFRIVDATERNGTISAIDDKNYPTDKNAELTINLVAGNVYYIEAFNYSSAYSYTLMIGYTPSATKTLTLNSPYTVITTKGSYQMLKFTPTTSGQYQFSTNKTSGDPQIFLYSSTGYCLSSDDDSGGSLNALLTYYLNAGNTYYVAVQGYNGNAAEFTVTVSKI